jgi:hypothetical protein
VFVGELKKALGCGHFGRIFAGQNQLGAIFLSVQRDDFWILLGSFFMSTLGRETLGYQSHI